MDPTDVTIEILRGIQSSIVGLREDMNARLTENGGRIDSLGSRLADLERHAIATNEALETLNTRAEITNQTLGVIRERLTFVEAASNVATDGRARLEQRVDRIEGRLDDLESRLE